MDLPGIYSLSPYTLEEVVARNYLITERPDAILNIIDGTNLERNLYLTTQLTELGIPVVIAINMMDVVRKNGDQINVAESSPRELGCEIVEISALKGDGVMQAAEAAVKAAKSGKTIPMHTFSGPWSTPSRTSRRRRSTICPRSSSAGTPSRSSSATIRCSKSCHPGRDHAAHRIRTSRPPRPSWTTMPRASSPTSATFTSHRSSRAATRKKNHGQLSASDKIDKIVTNRWLGLPIFAVVMFLVYWVAMVGVGAPATDWANDGLFGDGWHLFGIGTAEYTEVADNYTAAMDAVSGYYELDTEAEDFDADAALADMKAVQPDADSATIEVEDEETLARTR